LKQFLKNYFLLRNIIKKISQKSIRVYNKFFISLFLHIPLPLMSKKFHAIAYLTKAFSKFEEILPIQENLLWAR